MEHETEAIESDIGTNHDSVQSGETISAFVGRMNDQLRSRCSDDAMTVSGCSAGVGTVAGSGGSYTGSSYAMIGFAPLLKRLEVIFDTETVGGVPIDTHGTNAVNSGSDPIEASHTNDPQVIMTEIQQGVVSSITNRSGKDSDRHSNDATDEPQKRGEHLTIALHNTTGD